MDQLVEKGSRKEVPSTRKGQGSQSPILAHGAGLPNNPFSSGFILPFLDDYEGHQNQRGSGGREEPEERWSRKSGQMATGGVGRWLCPFLRKSVRTGRTKSH